MNIVVLGPGAIGSLWASHLSTAGHNVSLWARSSEALLSIQLDNGQAQSFLNQNKQALEQVDLLLVTVKAWQVENALTPLLSSINNDCILLFMHNGMGAIDPLRDRLQAYPVLLATTTHGALRTGSTKLHHAGKGTTQIGAYNAQGQQCEFMADVLNHSLPHVIWNPHIKTALWQKLAINCAINPLTALHQCRNGDLAKKQYQQKLDAIIKEVCLVMTAEGVNTLANELLFTVHQVITATARNFSSMHQDIVHKRPSEIDFITGYLIDTAKHHKIATPENEALYQAIKQIESSWNTHD
ncbi:2-dehydropantoate 2-reductase [Vibrio amylolyticus]|uniref:2-dehydropantoate 2-reductase n=1 Tax=Vibrio amylolyticus TaxID=2847292 RepID=UPI003552E5CF